MDDDLNISEGLATIFDFMREINAKMVPEGIDKRDAKEIYDFMLKINSVLGVIEFEKEKIPDEIKKLIKDRDMARKEKDYKKSDKIREVIKNKGYVLDDTESGTLVKNL